MSIKVAIFGLGNCASAFIQGLEHYKHVTAKAPPVPGLMHNAIGGYLIRDIKVVAAFDVHKYKIGKDISLAIWVKPNNAEKFATVPHKGVSVQAGYLADGIGLRLRNSFPLQSARKHEVVKALRKSGARIAINFLPTGSKKATRFYAEACIEAGVAFINGIPEFVASDPAWAARFKRAGLPCAGDDIKSQVGATIVNESLLRLIARRGLVTIRSRQSNRGGNFDFKNLMSGGRLASKRISKTEVLIAEAGTTDVIAGPTEYLPRLRDTKEAKICIRGIQFGDLPFSIKVKMAVQDSPNCAGMIVDAVRLMKVSLDRELSGYQKWSAYLFKHPLHILPYPRARRAIEHFLSRPETA